MDLLLFFCFYILNNKVQIVYYFTYYLRSAVKGFKFLCQAIFLWGCTPVLNHLLHIVVQMCYGHSRFFVFLAPHPCFPVPARGAFVVCLSSKQRNHSNLGRFWFVLFDTCNQSAARKIVQKGGKRGCTS